MEISTITYSRGGELYQGSHSPVKTSANVDSQPKNHVTESRERVDTKSKEQDEACRIDGELEGPNVLL